MAAIVNLPEMRLNLARLFQAPEEHRHRRLAHGDYDAAIAIDEALAIDQVHHLGAHF